MGWRLTVMNHEERRSVCQGCQRRQGGGGGDDARVGRQHQRQRGQRGRVISDEEGMPAVSGPSLDGSGDGREEAQLVERLGEIVERAELHSIDPWSYIF